MGVIDGDGDKNDSQSGSLGVLQVIFPAKWSKNWALHEVVDNG